MTFKKKRIFLRLDIFGVLMTGILITGICIGRISVNAESFFHTGKTENGKTELEMVETKISAEERTTTVSKKMLNVPMIYQNPELPTGCEVTSLAMVLQYYGYDIDKCTLADEYLPKGEIGETDFHYAFVGNPREENSYGCYAPAIMTTVKAFLADREQDSGMDECYVYNVTGTEFGELYDYLDEDIPVIVWGTMGNQEPYHTTSWIVDGEKITWIAREHCMVLCGYDKSENVVIVNDPMEGIHRYDAELFQQRYEQMGEQAIVVSGEELMV